MFHPRTRAQRLEVFSLFRTKVVKLASTFQEAEKRPMSKDSLSASCTISTVVTPDSLNNLNGNDTGDNDGYNDVLDALKRLENEGEEDIVNGKLLAAHSRGEASPNKRCNTAASGTGNSDRISALYSYLDAVENGDSEGNSATRSPMEDVNSSRTAMHKGERR